MTARAVSLTLSAPPPTAPRTLLESLALLQTTHPTPLRVSVKTQTLLATSEAVLRVSSMIMHTKAGTTTTASFIYTRTQMSRSMRPQQKPIRLMLTRLPRASQLQESLRIRRQRPNMLLRLILTSHPAKPPAHTLRRPHM
ncbi:hypothetical protein RSAG8_02346, partial [Rhizoctonia solani AG-8 WAC10335]